MNKNKYTNEEIEKLKQNPNVFRCTENMIVYTYEFKKGALEQYNHGIGSKEIWRRAGFDVSKWKKNYFKDTVKGWRRIARTHSLEGLAKIQGSHFKGRPKTKGLTDADKIKRLELQVRYLKAENDFLVKLRAKRAERYSGQKKNSESLDN